jgi:hypothetical protein
MLPVSVVNKIGEQDSHLRGTMNAVIVPREIIFPVVAYQPECPLKLIPSKILAYLDGGGREILSCRNLGAQPIKSYTVAWRSSVGTGGKLVADSEWITPGEEVSLLSEPRYTKQVPLTDDLRKKLKLEGPMQAILVFMVVKVEFADGAIFQDENAYKALQDYFEKMAR